MHGGRPVDELARGLDVAGHVRQGHLHGLLLRERPPELDARAHVRHRLVERALREADRRGADRGAEAVQRAERGAHAVALLADAIDGRDAHALEAHLADGVAAEDGDRARAEARRAGRHHEGAQAPPLPGRRRRREDRVDVGHAGVRDEDLRAVEHVAVPLAARGRGDAREVRAGLRLREREGRDLLASHDGGQPALALRVVAERGDGVAAEALHGEGELEQRRGVAEPLAREGRPRARRRAGRSGHP
ncbi:MAG: hypothetical protein M5U28_07405 [Sandaracinaceae bacterium]|nr:hypothetical protein [Sandaracinaceae bacterium]